MSISYIMGLLLGGVLGILLVAIIVRICRGRWTLRCKNEYDERQHIARGKAYRDGFWFMAISLLLLTIITQTLPGFVTSYMRECVMTICFAGLGVYVVSCVMRDAYLGLHDKPKRWSTAIGAIALMNLIIGIRNAHANGVREGLLNLYCAILLLLVLFSLGIHEIMLKRMDKGEDI